MYYNEKIEDIEKKLQTNENGLNDEEVKKRIEKYGLNSLPKKKKDSVFKIFVNEFKDPIVILLLFAIFASLVAGEVIDALAFGINAFGISEIEPESLALIIKTVAKGACWFDPIAASAVMSYFPKQKDVINNEEQTLTPLSEREKEVLRLLVKGMSNTAIAKELIVSVHTAKAHVCNIFQKMKVTDRVQAAVKAVNFNLI